jgi:hypothetical protein
MNINQTDIKTAKRFDMIISQHIKSASKVSEIFGYKSSTMISNLRNVNHVSTLNQLHKDGLEKYFDIPLTVWDDLDTSAIEVELLIINYRERKKQSKEIKKSDSIFQENSKLFNKLKGVWYAYLYASNPESAKDTLGIWIVETTIHDDYTVIDYWGNVGYLKLGKHESLIIKESYDNDDLTIIRFPNRQVPSSHFRFVILSNQNNTEHEMVNFGFYSRIKYSAKEAKKILGEINNLQLKLDLDFNDRINKKGIVPK